MAEKGFGQRVGWLRFGIIMFSLIRVGAVSEIYKRHIKSNIAAKAPVLFHCYTIRLYSRRSYAHGKGGISK